MGTADSNGALQTQTTTFDFYFPAAWTWRCTGLCWSVSERLKRAWLSEFAVCASVSGSRSEIAQVSVSAAKRPMVLCLCKKQGSLEESCQLSTMMD